MASEQWSVMEEPSEPTAQVLAHPVGSWLVLPADVGTLVPGGIPGKGGGLLSAPATPSHPLHPTSCRLHRLSPLV